MTLARLQLSGTWARLALIGLLGVAFAERVGAHEPVDTEEVRIGCDVADLAATVHRPAAPKAVPCVILLGGSLSHTRDGGMARPGVPPRDALRRLAEALAEGGYASLRYDKPGHGQSKTTARWSGSYADEATAAAAVIRWARNRSEFPRLIVAGESAGAYVACLAAKAGVVADAYVFLGGLCSPAEEMYAHTFGGLARYAASKPERLEWAERHARYELALGRTFRAMLTAAAAGESEFQMVDGDYRAKVGGLARRREEQQDPPDEMFRFIQVPALALAGAMDLNVPPHHAARAVEIMQRAGNRLASSILVAGADHSFQQTPADEDERFRERYTFASFNRPYETLTYRLILTWLQSVVPSVPPRVSVPLRLTASSQRALNAPERDARTATTPERLQLAPGVEIIEDITDKQKAAAVETLEGRIGPLLLADGCQAHFIDMHAGMYVEEHPHNSESIIYTVRGKWVLCSKGRRHVMQAGSLFRFAAKVPTGYEVPFTEDAFILIFKGNRTTKVEKEFIDYLTGMAARLHKEQKEGIPYLLKDLPIEHPARRFARAVNPEFDKRLKGND